jgi:hypothetical protein
MKAELEKLMKEELERPVKTAVEIFDESFLECARCKRTHAKGMTPDITSIYADVHMEMRQADPMDVTKWMIDNWMKTFEKVNVAYQREFSVTRRACDKIVQMKQTSKETWV